MVFGPPEGRDRVSPISVVIGDPLAHWIRVPEGRAAPTQFAALVAALTGSLADVQQGWNCMDALIWPLASGMRSARVAVTAWRWSRASAPSA